MELLNLSTWDDEYFDWKTSNFSILYNDNLSWYSIEYNWSIDNSTWSNLINDYIKNLIDNKVNKIIWTDLNLKFNNLELSKTNFLSLLNEINDKVDLNNSNSTFSRIILSNLIIDENINLTKYQNVEVWWFWWWFLKKANNITLGWLNKLIILWFDLNSYTWINYNPNINYESFNNSLSDFRFIYWKNEKDWDKKLDLNLNNFLNFSNDVKINDFKIENYNNDKKINIENIDLNNKQINKIEINSNVANLNIENNNILNNINI